MKYFNSTQSSLQAENNFLNAFLCTTDVISLPTHINLITGNGWSSELVSLNEDLCIVNGDKKLVDSREKTS